MNCRCESIALKDKFPPASVGHTAYMTKGIIFCFLNTPKLDRISLGLDGRMVTNSIRDAKCTGLKEED